MAFLRRVTLPRGTRYAIETVSRYIIIIVVGVLIASDIIGIGWSKLQWLVAALSVGLGFGLQEIFANFVSGLILLFELRVFFKDVLIRLRLTHELNKAINESFAEHDIEIAFPQRDIHIRSVEGGNNGGS